MPTPVTNDAYEHETTCDDSAAVCRVLLATGSALFLAYFVGRVGFPRDVREALRRIAESRDSIQPPIRAL